MCSKYYLQNEICFAERESTKSTVQSKVQVKFSVYNILMQCTLIYIEREVEANFVCMSISSVDKGLRSASSEYSLHCNLHAVFPFNIGKSWM